MMTHPKSILTVLMAIVCLIFLSQLRLKLEKKAETRAFTTEDGRTYLIGIENPDDPLLAAFVKDFPNREVILSGRCDLTGDDIEDLYLISHDQTMDEISSSVVIASDNDIVSYTPFVPAPRENQRVRFFEMDGDEPMEISISGEKDGAVGYAVCRIIDGEIIDLFGEGMEDCC